MTVGVLPTGALEALIELVGRFAKEHHCPSISWGLVTDGRLDTTGVFDLGRVADSWLLLAAHD